MASRMSSIDGSSVDNPMPSVTTVIVVLWPSRSRMSKRVGAAGLASGVHLGAELAVADVVVGVPAVLAGQDLHAPG